MSHYFKPAKEHVLGPLWIRVPFAGETCPLTSRSGYDELHRDTPHIRLS